MGKAQPRCALVELVENFKLSLISFIDRYNTFRDLGCSLYFLAAKNLV